MNLLLKLYIVGVIWCAFMLFTFCLKMIGYCKDHGLKNNNVSIFTSIAMWLEVAVFVLLPVCNYILGLSILLYKSDDFDRYMRNEYRKGNFISKDPNDLSYEEYCKYGYIYGSGNFLDRCRKDPEEINNEQNYAAEEHGSDSMLQ